MTDTDKEITPEMISEVNARFNFVSGAVEKILEAVFGNEKKFVLCIGADDDPSKTVAIISNVANHEEGSALIESAYRRDKSDNALETAGRNPIQ